MKRIRLFISGYVQGVGFRWYVQRLAKRINVYGFVRNLRDGRVEALVEGKDELVEQFLQNLKEGSFKDQLEEIKKSEEEYQKEYSDFTIKF
ncbi:MAG: acylphosphatase [bacterium (Candidatus Ratteibacteria) CG_4_10_14_3_um_filter_41_18]|uniref:Acylphosphatase n=2 Tax=Candidatus Ratteibacteria TaxID=2979319 RepID=A0A2M7E6V0_9BACT|nr:MAG: acylphosphatase [bacterium (Candidatus Ratteibacteria) CG01_land_8_20_14_3_00_40_19]PIX76759.1 MAG: acylphosphatase [bacterium (Candidatus Ratteibacteria) CG_4_10_14_3_um_filter_41_18]